MLYRFVCRGIMNSVLLVNYIHGLQSRNHSQSNIHDGVLISMNNNNLQNLVASDVYKKQNKTLISCSCAIFLDE